MADEVIPRWLQEIEGRRGPANLTTRRETIAGELPGASDGVRSTLRFPPAAGIRNPVWTGEINEARLGQIVDSPVRAEIARRLLKGECAVWVLIESGDGPADDRVASKLESRLEWLEGSLEMATLDPADVAAGLVSAPQSELRVAFSLLRLSRSDDAEWALVSMLLGTEGDLNDFNEPIAMPVFGRGRVLYGLVGSGISESNIDQACAFLVGPCSCQAKDLNPGVDLLMTADWEAGITPSIITSRQSPALAGLAAFETGPNPASRSQGLPPVRTPVVSHDPPAPAPPAPMTASVAGGDEAVDSPMPSALPEGIPAGNQTVSPLPRLGPALGGVSFIALLILLLGTWVLLRRGP